MDIHQVSHPVSRIQHPVSEAFCVTAVIKSKIIDIRHPLSDICYLRNQATRSVWREASHCVKASSDFALRHCWAVSQPLRATATPQRV